jgi:hypothetical protein
MYLHLTEGFRFGYVIFSLMHDASYTLLNSKLLRIMILLILHVMMLGHKIESLMVRLMILLMLHVMMIRYKTDDSI